MRSYTINSEAYNGPLDLLLQLIESQELDITQVSLAQVADQYVSFVENNPEILPEDIADFLVIAAKLILIKSKALLPTLEIIEDANELEKQLKMYKLYLDATKKIESIVAHKNFTYSHTSFPAQFIQGFVPPKKQITTERMRDLYDLVIKRLEPIIMLPKRIIERVVTIREKIENIRDAILKHSKISFKHFLSNGAGKSEKIVSFLALLELVKQKIIQVEQGDFLGEIEISKTDDAEKLQVSTETEFL